MRPTPVNPGDRFGSLVAVKKLPSSTHNIWTFHCDCGADKDMRVYEVIAGKIQSCGCYSLIHGRYKKYSDSRQSTAARVFAEYQQAAKKRDYSWNLSLEQFQGLIYRPCHYCGVPYSMERNAWLKPDGTKKPGAIRKNVRDEWIAGATIQYNGVDRINNEQGYTVENTVPCCKNCNIGKGTKSPAEFLEWVRRVASHNGH